MGASVELPHGVLGIEAFHQATEHSCQAGSSTLSTNTHGHFLLLAHSCAESLAKISPRWPGCLCLHTYISRFEALWVMFFSPSVSVALGLFRIPTPHWCTTLIRISNAPTLLRYLAPRVNNYQDNCINFLKRSIRWLRPWKPCLRKELQRFSCPHITICYFYRKEDGKLTVNCAYYGWHYGTGGEFFWASPLPVYKLKSTRRKLESLTSNTVGHRQIGRQDFHMRRRMHSQLLVVPATSWCLNG